MKFFFFYIGSRLCNHLRIVVVDDVIFGLKSVFVVVVVGKNDEELPVQNESHKTV